MRMPAAHIWLSDCVVAGPVAVAVKVLSLVGQSSPKKGVPRITLPAGTAAAYCGHGGDVAEERRGQRGGGLRRGGEVGGVLHDEEGIDGVRQGGNVVEAGRVAGRARRRCPSSPASAD